MKGPRGVQGDREDGGAGGNTDVGGKWAGSRWVLASGTKAEDCGKGRSHF